MAAPLPSTLEPIPIESDHSRMGYPTRYPRFPPGTPGYVRRQWFPWVEQVLLPAVNDFVHQFGQTTIPLDRRSNFLRLFHEIETYCLELSKVIFEGTPPQFPLNHRPLPVFQVTSPTNFAVSSPQVLPPSSQGLKQNSAALSGQEIHLRLPGIEAKTAILPSERVFVPAPGAFVGLRRPDPPRTALVLSPQISNEPRHGSSALPRVIEFYEHRDGHSTFPVLCQGPTSSMEDLAKGVLAGEPNRPWTYKSGETYWTAINPLSTCRNASWLVKFSDPDIRVWITFDIPSLPPPLPSLANFAPILPPVGTPPFPPPPPHQFHAIPRS
ncbi:uncharacterized protein JCM6883_005816 [Sporobolomyces salmoneus]|uniref:uncharacterized protein n=1 Tax=Sporobolomyces salmoneus TaxID=183962 RepID=UPI00316BB9D5